MHPQPGDPQYPYGQQPQGPPPYGSQPYGRPGSVQPPYGSPGGYAGAPMERPGTVLAVRIMTFVAAVLALLLAVVLLAIGLLPGAMQDGFTSAATADATEEDVVPVLALTAGGIFGGYGLVSLFLGIFGGRRSGAVWWIQIAFQGLMLALTVVLLLTGGVGAIVLLVYTGVIVLLLSLAPSRAWYTG